MDVLDSATALLNKCSLSLPLVAEAFVRAVGVCHVVDGDELERRGKMARYQAMRQSSKEIRLLQREKYPAEDKVENQSKEEKEDKLERELNEEKEESPAEVGDLTV